MFISKSSKLLPKYIPNRGYLGSKLGGFWCGFYTSRHKCGVIFTPRICSFGVRKMMLPEFRGPLRSPGNPVTFEFEASSFDLFFVFFVVFVEEFFCLVVVIEFVDFFTAASSSSNQSD